MLNLLLILFGKFLSNVFRLLNLGDGSTWPGHIALHLNKNFIKQTLGSSKTKIIIVAGTNGKTTTASIIKTVLKKNGKKVMQNKSGANLPNGIASSIIIHAGVNGKLKKDFAIFEIDENALPLILQDIEPDYLIFLNLFRDQLDRYGEVNIISARWRKAVSKLTEKTTLVLNTDDPQIAYFAKKTKATSAFFGVEEANTTMSEVQHASDSTYCPNCDNKLTYKKTVFSHLGDWHCSKCGASRPKPDLSDFGHFPLSGVYNKYNTLAAALTLERAGLSEKQIIDSLQDFKPAFGRQEILTYRNKKVQIFLSKNPISFNQSFQTISGLGAKTILFVLNDRIPDGRDISWIWDTDLPGINSFKHILISGDRVYDMALRLEYELGIMNYESRAKTFEDLDQAVDTSIDLLENNETLFILPTYSAMLESRKILTGKKIL